MHKMAVSLDSNYSFSCLNCLSLIFVSGTITHYAEQALSGSVSNLLIVDVSSECNERIRLQEMGVDMKRGNINRSLRKDKIVCKRCERILGFVKREATRRDDDQLDKFFFRIDALTSNPEMFEILEMVKEKFDQLVQEINTEKKERRQRRQQKILELREAIMKISSDISIDSRNRIHRTQPKQNIGFKILPQCTSRNIFPKNLLLSNDFLVVSVCKKSPTVTVNPNPRSCLKKTHELSNSIQSLELSKQRQTYNRLAEQSNNKCYLKVNLANVSAYNKIFALRTYLQTIDNSPLRLFHALFIRSKIYCNILHRLLKNQTNEKQKATNDFKTKLLKNEDNNASRQFD